MNEEHTYRHSAVRKLYPMNGNSVRSVIRHALDFQYIEAFDVSAGQRMYWLSAQGLRLAASAWSSG